MFTQCLRVTKMLVSLLAVNHLIACFWVWLGSSSDSGWIYIHGFYLTSSVHKYLIALHWSFSQFHGAMEVSPVNAQERLVAILVLVVALFGFSMFLSGLTESALAVLRARRTHQTLQLAMNSFCTTHRMSASTRDNLRAAVNRAHYHQESSQTEHVLLNSLPSQLRMDVLYDVRQAIVKKHPLWKRLGEGFERMLGHICADALTNTTFRSGDVIFVFGDASSTMYFIQEGKVIYEVNNLASSASLTEFVEVFKKYEWISEPALWTQWTHVGSLATRPREKADMLMVHRDMFMQVVLQYMDAYQEVVRYALFFVEQMMGCSITD